MGEFYQPLPKTNILLRHENLRFGPDLASAGAWKDGRKQYWGHRGDKKKVFGDGPAAVN